MQMESVVAESLSDCGSVERFLPCSYEEDRYSVYEEQSCRIEVPHVAPVSISQLLLSVDSIQCAMDYAIYPERANDGTGGVYFCLNRGEGVEAVFKPLSEEPYCDANPRNLHSGLFNESVDRGVRPGSGGLRELAAYYLDQDHFAGVPETVLASFPNACFSSPESRVIGSLQLFVPHECSSEDYGPVMYSVDVRISVLNDS